MHKDQSIYKLNIVLILCLIAKYCSFIRFPGNLVLLSKLTSCEILKKASYDRNGKKLRFPLITKSKANKNSMIFV